MLHIEMTPQEMRRYLKYFRREENCPYEYSEQCIIDWVTDVLARHCPYTCEEELELYLTGKFFRHFKGNVYRIEDFAKDR